MNNQSNLELYKQHQFLQNYYLFLTIVEELELLQSQHNVNVIINREQKRSVPIDNLFDVQIRKNNKTFPLITLYENELFNDAKTLAEKIFKIAEEINKPQYASILNDFNILNKSLLFNIFNILIDDEFSSKFLQHELNLTLSTSNKEEKKPKI